MLVTLFLYLFLQVSSAVTNKDKWCDPDANHGEHTLERGSTCVLTEETHVPEGKKLTLGATSGNGAMPIITVAPHGLSREGMFLVSGELQISDIIIENHHGGAAIGASAIGTSALNVTIHLINSIIRNCTCSVEISQCWGGAVAQHGGTLILEKSQIESNTALRAGGIYTFNTNIQVIGGISSLSNNNARSDCGGALYLEHGTLSISGAGVQLLVQGNTAAICGGGMQIQYSTIQVSNGASMIIKNNSATSTKYLEEPKSRGGGIFLAKTSLEISGDGSYLLMDKNTVYSYGGSIYAATESVVTVSSGAILKVTNSRGRVGGGVHISRKSNIDIHGHGSILLIDGNTAQDRGGGVYAALEANIATSSNAHVIVTNNRAHSVGGGFCVEDSGTRIDSFKSASVQMKDNVAHQNGGAIALRSGAVVRFASSSMFQSNRAVVGYGGAIAYDDNNGLQNGGSGCTKVLMEVVLHGQEFNYVDVIDKDERLESKSSKSIFISTVPTSVLNGYAMRALIADKTTSLCIPCGAYTFVAGTGDNTYLPPNSFISLIIPRSYNNEDDQMLVNFSNVLQEESTPQTDIRISCVEQSSVKVADAHFVTNFAELHGGAIATSDSYKNAFMSIENTTFVRNTAKKGKGGAIRISGSQTAINVSHATFIGNEANFGGAISIDNAASMHMADTVASDNIANLGNGGFIFVRVASPIFLRDVHINTGHAMKGGGGGGAIYSSMVAMERVTVTGCRAGSGGGGGLLLGGEAQVHLLDCLLKDNQATSSGGHIFVLASTLLVHSKGVVLIWPNQEPVFPSETNLISNGATSMTNSRSSLSGGSIFCLGSQSSAGVLNIYDQADVISAVCSTDFIKYRETSAVDDSYACASKGVFLGRETSIRHSTAESGGGVSANLCTLHMSNITIFNGTSTKGNGGAILVSMESTLHVDGNSRFEASNSLQGSGGAISCEECGLMSFSGGTVFQSNSAQKSGGAIHLSSPTKPIVSRGSKYKGNSAQQLNGGAVDMHGGTNWTSIGDTFDGNIALSGSGGAVSSFASRVHFDASTFCVQNQASKGGGGCVLWESNAINQHDDKWTYFEPAVSNMQQVSNNHALYGSQFATPGVSLRIVNTTKMTTGKDNLLNPRFPKVELLDWYGSAVRGAFAMNVDVTAKLRNSDAELFGATSATIIHNTGEASSFQALFSELGIQGVPRSGPHELFFESLLDVAGSSNIERFLNTSNVLNTFVRGCTGKLFLAGSKQCESCPVNAVLNEGIKEGEMKDVCSCNENYYQEITIAGKVGCTKCPSSSESEKGSTTLANCTCYDGLFVNDKGVCKSCPVNSRLQQGVTSGISQNVCSCNPNYYREITYGDVMTCSKCPAESTSKAGSIASTECQCNVGYYPNSDSDACVLPNWITTCNDDTLYLNNTSSNKYDWNCLKCPAGGSCKGEITKKDIKVLFGWGRCRPRKQHEEEWFEKCEFGGACLGSRNDNLKDKFLDTEGNDLATTKDHNESCSKSNKNNTLLCAACAPGFSHSGLGKECKKCPSSAQNIAIAVFGVLGGIAGLCIFIQLTLSDGGTNEEADGAMSIGLSFVQIISLLSTFPIAWPDIFITLFRVGGAVTVLGQHLVNLKCMYPDQSEADVFYTTRIVWSILPIVVSILCVSVWFLLSKCMEIIELRTKIQSSVVALLYLLWPGICSETFAIFSCRTICGQSLLRADINELCWQGRHSTFAVLGVVMLIFYVIGLPLLAFGLIYRQRLETFAKSQDLSDHRSHAIFGLLYSSYSPNVWFWELTVAIRKVVIVAIGVFGTEMGEMQVHATACVLVVIIVLTSLVKPYGNSAILQMLELFTLLAIWFTLWAGTVFNTHPKCEGTDGPLGWCNFLSVVIGILIISCAVAIVAVVLFYKKKRICNLCFETYFEHSFTKRLQRSESKRTLKEKEEKRRKRMERSETKFYDNPSINISKESKEIGIEMVAHVNQAILTDSDTCSIKEDNEEDGMNRCIAENPLYVELENIPSMVQILENDEGRKYIFNPNTGDSQWLDDVDIHVDDESGRSYSYNATTDETQWLS